MIKSNIEYTLYLDMDGVLADFDYCWDYYKGSPNNSSSVWEKAIKEKMFEKLPLCEHAEEFMKELNKLPIKIEILGSLGGIRFSKQVKEQKLKWLEDNDIKYTPNFVVHRSLKKNYAGAFKILVDDLVSNVNEFNEANGYGIVYKDEQWKKVLKEIKHHINY